MNEPKILNRFAHIDTLRGLAALYVFFFHLALLPNPDLGVPLWAKRIVHTGGTGVTLFFVVSAFTLCYSLRGRSDRPHPIYEFYVRRIFRIVPLFYVWVVLSLMRDGYLYGKTQSFGDIFLSTFFVFNLIPGKETGFVWASWTLGVEMLFYLIFPLIFRLITDYRRALALFLFTVVVSKAFQGFVAYLALSEEQSKSFYHFSFLHQLPIFAIGVFVFYLYESFIENKNIDRVWGVVLLAAFVFIYDAILSGHLQNVVLEGLYWQAIAYGCLLLGLSIFPWKVIVNKFSMFLGLISYSVYLSHTSVIVAFAFLYSRIYSLGMPTSLKFFLSAVIPLAVIILVSYVSYRLIEEPGMRLGRWLIRRRTLSSYPAEPVGEAGTKVA